MRATIVLLILAAACGAPQEAQQPQRARRVGVEAKPRTLEQRWLAAECGVGDRGVLARLVRRKGRAAEETYMRAMDQGPPKQELDRMRASIEGLYEKREYELEKEYFKKCIASDELEGAMTITASQYVDHFVKCLTVAYRTRAIMALDLIDSKRAIPHFERILRQDNLHPAIERAARRALAHAEKRNR